MSFQIAGIKILPGCEPSIRKVLKDGELYLFSNRYSADIENELILNDKGEENSCATSLYDVVWGTHSIQVSVNAIVGKNGDGKSALIELLLRILNNFAYSFGFLYDQGSLVFVDGVCAILYYVIDGCVYSIKCDRHIVSWYKNGVKLALEEMTDAEKKSFLKDNLQPDLFYTMVINYSLYAYTPASLGGTIIDGKYWVDSLFHKNDSYQTPVVLNPMRTNGNIDVNREDYLSRQRLLSLFVVSNNVEDNTRYISLSDNAVGYAFSLEKESKFNRKTVQNYLLSHFQDELSWDDFKPYEYSADLIPDSFIESFKEFWYSFRNEINTNRELVHLFKDCLIDYKRRGKSDLRHYLTQIHNKVNPVNPKAKKRTNNIFGAEFGTLVNTNGDLSKLNYRQFYRFLLILLVWRCLTTTNKCGMEDESLDTVLREHYQPRNAAKLYLIYKFISIVETYKGLTNGYYLTDEYYLTLVRRWPSESVLRDITNDLNTILKTNDYRTLKFKQTVNYLKQTEEYYGADRNTMTGIDYDFVLSFETLSTKMKTRSLKDIQWNLPCPIFEGDIVLHNGDEYFPLDTLSSGMIQRLNSVGSLIYHLRNLDDEQTGTTQLAYENVTIILEEVELYYHPEYQKSYLDYLLKQIERAELSRIKRINLVFITHSPFVLSDILRDNILCLENGYQVTPEIKTFGANIHDLLRNPFFMKDGTVGDFAQNLINRIIVCLAVYDSFNKINGPSKQLVMENFYNQNVDLVDYGGFLPVKDGVLDYQLFNDHYSFSYLKDAIKLVDEPILKNAFERSYNRIVDVAPGNSI